MKKQCLDGTYVRTPALVNNEVAIEGSLLSKNDLHLIGYLYYKIIIQILYKLYLLCKCCILHYGRENFLFS